MISPKSAITVRPLEEDAYLVTADLELGHVPSGILVRGSLDVSKLCLVRRVVVLDVERQLELEELMALAPVNLGLEAEERARGLLKSCRDRIQRDLYPRIQHENIVDEDKK